MFFIVAFLIIASACATITVRTLVGYSGFSLSKKALISAFVFVGWFSSIFVRLLKNSNYVSPEIYNFLHTTSYTLLGFVFLLFCFLMLRDIVWYAIYGMARLFGKDAWSINPKNLSAIQSYHCKL